MNEIDELLERLRVSGIRLALEGDRLSVSSPKGALTDALRAELTGRKDELKGRLRQLAEARSDAASPPGVSPVARLAVMPVSHAQRRMWLLKQLDPASAAYHVPSAFRLEGELDVPALEQSLNELVLRHESLRMRFMTVDDEPRCAVDISGRLALEHHDLSALPAAQRESQALQRVVAIARRPFDLSLSPLLHAALIRLAPEVHVFCFVFDHIISDGMSVAIFLDELRLLYEGRISGMPVALAPIDLGYPDYVEWQRCSLAAGALEKHLAFWKQQLTGLPSALMLPTDHLRPPMRSESGAIHALTLAPAFAAQLKTFARQQGATLYMVLLAAYQVLLSRYAGAAEFAVGTAVANRNQPEVERVIGLFANNIVIRADLTGNPTVQELITRVSEASRKAFAHQDMPFDVLVEALKLQRDADQPPIFQTMFTLHTQLVMNFNLAAVTCSPLAFQAGTSRFDLSADVFDLPDGMRVCFEYRTDLFDAASIERMVANYQVVLQSFLAAPDQHVQALPILTAAERRVVLETANDTEVAIGEESFIQRFERQADRSPDAVAVSFEGTSLSYAELRRRADQLAHQLARQGVGCGAVVAICLERSLALVVALLGVQKAGAAYLPLDPGFPADRISYMLSDSEAAALVTSRGARRRLGSTSGMLVIDVDDQSGADDGGVHEPALAAVPGEIAYVIYTSGSTGRPKGVVVTHRALSNFLASMERTPGLDAADVLAAVTTISFDIAGLEIYLPLVVGARIELIGSRVSNDGEALARELDACGATVMQATPATWRLLMEVDWRCTRQFKALSGGEPLPRALADSLLERVDELWNLYGPTETTIWSTAERILPDAAPITIGRPIANTRIYVLDPGGAPVPIGVAGELWIGGAGVAAGYHRRPELTAERFAVDPFTVEEGARMYRTGDLARWRADGRLEHLGRLDHQVKIRGFRIELGEIEAVLATLPGVAQALVVAHQVAEGDARLVAYLVFSAGADLTASEVRQALRQGLPAYMIPAAVVPLDAMPLTPNGKVDRAALPNPFQTSARQVEADAPPAPGMEQFLADLWRDVLKVEQIGASDNFFDLGGHSLLSVRVAAAVHRATGWRMDPRTLFFQSLREVAAAAPGGFPAKLGQVGAQAAATAGATQ